ncbi:hypothetical protein FOCC_FOCC001723 [Frankliniella occidentalis]|nr:hypothetical protein FOCC_FOCC001723 [Frankliniella occidentalis]
MMTLSSPLPNKEASEHRSVQPPSPLLLRTAAQATRGTHLVQLSPSIWMSSSALKRREASCSESVPRCEQSESISSMKMVLGAKKRAISNSRRTNFSESPRYLEVSVADDTLKKVVPHSVATAFASIVLPVPGGPTISTPFHGRRIPCEVADICQCTVLFIVVLVRAYLEKVRHKDGQDDGLLKHPLGVLQARNARPSHIRVPLQDVLLQGVDEVPLVAGGVEVITKHTNLQLIDNDSELTM